MAELGWIIATVVLVLLGIGLSFWAAWIVRRRPEHDRPEHNETLRAGQSAPDDDLTAARRAGGLTAWMRGGGGV